MSVPARSRFLSVSHLLSLLFWVLSLYPAFQLFQGDPFGLSALFAAVLGFQLGLLRTRRLAQRTHAPEVFYLSFFLILSTGELFRVWFLWLKFFPQWAQYQVLAVRTVYFFRLTAVLAFFVASLYPLGWRYKRSSRIGLLLILLGGMVAGMLPVNSNLYQPNGLFVVGEEALFQSLLAAFFLLALASRAIAFIRQQVRETAVATLVLSVFALFYLLLLYGWEVVAAPGILVAGAFFLRLLKKEYEWT